MYQNAPYPAKRFFLEKWLPRTNPVPWWGDTHRRLICAYPVALVYSDGHDVCITICNKTAEVFVRMSTEENLCL